RTVCDRARTVVEVVHREVHAVELAPGHRQVARHACPGRDHDGVVPLEQLGGIEIAADVDAQPDLDALGAKLVDATVDKPLLELELRDTEAHEAAGRLVALVHRDRFPGPGELLRTREPGRPRTDDRDAPPGPLRRQLRCDPALLPRAVHDRELDLLDRDGVALVDLEHARGLARRRAESPRELGEVVRAVELLDRLAPPVAVHEVVPVGNQVAQRAAVVAEGNAALHAARRLVSNADDGQRPDELAVIADALARVALRRGRAIVLEEAAQLAHQMAGRRSAWMLDERRPSDARMQGAPIAEAIGATGDAVSAQACSRRAPRSIRRPAIYAAASVSRVRKPTPPAETASASARLKSCGSTLTNRSGAASHRSSTRAATAESVRSRCSATSARTTSRSPSSSGSSPTSSVLQRAAKAPSSSRT